MIVMAHHLGEDRLIQAVVPAGEAGVGSGVGRAR